MTQNNPPAALVLAQDGGYIVDVPNTGYSNSYQVLIDGKPSANRVTVPTKPTKIEQGQLRQIVIGYRDAAGADIDYTPAQFKTERDALEDALRFATQNAPRNVEGSGPAYETDAIIDAKVALARFDRDHVPRRETRVLDVMELPIVFLEYPKLDDPFFGPFAPTQRGDSLYKAHNQASLRDMVGVSWNYTDSVKSFIKDLGTEFGLSGLSVYVQNRKVSAYFSCPAKGITSTKAIEVAALAEDYVKLSGTYAEISKRRDDHFGKIRGAILAIINANSVPLNAETEIAAWASVQSELASVSARGKSEESLGRARARIEKQIADLKAMAAGGKVP